MSKKIIVAGMLVFCILFGCAFSYAAFTSTITAGGTVSAKGNFDVRFNTTAGTAFDLLDSVSGVTVKVKENGVTSDDDGNPSDKLLLDIKVPANFNSSFSFNVPVKNYGSVDAWASVANQTDHATTSKTQSNVTIKAETATVPVNGTANIKVTVSASTALTAGSTINGITLVVTYHQPAVAAAPTAAHSHS